jgi:protein gp37
MANRFGEKWGGWGKGKPRVLAKNWDAPVKWDKQSLQAWDAERGKGLPFSHPPRPTVFPSLCDWLDPEVPVEWLARFIRLIHDTPNLTWLLLTKRPELWRERINRAVAVHCDEPWSSERADVRNWLIKWVDHGIAPANVWVGTSVEDRPRADERIPALLQIPAVGRFLSVEPLLGPVDVRCGFDHLVHPDRPTINWVIIGGESGPSARPCNVEWVRSLVRQSQGAGVPVFVKQLGARPVGRWTASPAESGLGEGWPAGLKIAHPKGGDPAEWPEDLRVREFPAGLRGGVA